MSIEDDYHPRHPTTSKTNVILLETKLDTSDNQLSENWRIMLAYQLVPLSFSFIRWIRYENTIRKISVYIVNRRANVCLEIENQVSNDSRFIKLIFTDDATRACWYELHPKQCRHVQSNIITMFLFFIFFI